jgi:dipeptidase E
MTLYLAGGGDENQSFLLDEDFCKEIGKGNNILYVPVAQANLEKYSACKTWFSNCMKKHGVTEIEMCTDLSQLNDLKRFAGIYIGGGNTFKLLNAIRETSFESLISNYLDSGGIVYGGSAGAIIFGKSIDIVRYGCNDDNMANITDFSGLNRLNNWDVQCHFRLAWLDKHLSYAKETSSTLLAIPEESGLKLSNDKLIVIGTKPVIFIYGDKHESIQAGISISLAKNC